MTDTPMRERIIDSEPFQAIYRRWRDEILRRHRTTGNLAIIGIKRRGVCLARRIRADIEGARGGEIDFGELDITLYRDDYHLKRKKPMVLGTAIPFEVENRRILLVDDVLYTGRTVRAGMNQIYDFGRPEAIELAVFIDRDHRELPIAATFVGEAVETRAGDHVYVLCEELDGRDGVEIERG